MDKKHPHQYGKKRVTGHRKGVAPVNALKKRRSGQVRICYIEELKKTKETKYGRRASLWKKALEYATMIGEQVRLEIGNEFFDAKEAGLVRGYPSGSDATATNSIRPVVNDDSSHRDNSAAGNTNVLLSPRALKGRGRQQPEDVNKQDKGEQYSILEDVQHIGNDRYCRVCGGEFENEPKRDKLKWIGCQVDDCPYWLHCKCLLGDSVKITPKFCKELPFKCVLHRV